MPTALDSKGDDNPADVGTTIDDDELDSSDEDISDDDEEGRPKKKQKVAKEIIDVDDDDTSIDEKTTKESGNNNDNNNNKRKRGDDGPTLHSFFTKKHGIKTKRTFDPKTGLLKKLKVPDYRPKNKGDKELHKEAASMLGYIKLPQRRPTKQSSVEPPTIAPPEKPAAPKPKLQPKKKRGPRTNWNEGVNKLAMDAAVMVLVAGGEMADALNAAKVHINGNIPRQTVLSRYKAYQKAVANEKHEEEKNDDDEEDNYNYDDFDRKKDNNVGGRGLSVIFC